MHNRTIRIVLLCTVFLLCCSSKTQPALKGFGIWYYANEYSFQGMGTVCLPQVVDEVGVGEFQPSILGQMSDREKANRKWRMDELTKYLSIELSSTGLVVNQTERCANEDLTVKCVMNEVDAKRLYIPIILAYSVRAEFACEFSSNSELRKRQYEVQGKEYSPTGLFVSPDTALSRACARASEELARMLVGDVIAMLPEDS